MCESESERKAKSGKERTAESLNTCETTARQMPLSIEHWCLLLWDEVTFTDQRVYILVKFKQINSRIKLKLNTWEEAEFLLFLELAR